jgi:arginyl-tRNA synthetase
MYCGEYIKDLAHQLLETYQDRFVGKDEEEWGSEISIFAVSKLLECIKRDMESLGVVMDVYTSESSVCQRNLVEEALKCLRKRDDVYEGVLPRPKGISCEDDWEERPQTLFRSTKYGDSIDRAIQKSDGTWTYFAGDLAYHLDKIRREYQEMLAVLGADHGGYVSRLKAAVAALSDGAANLEVRLYQLVNFMENGKPVKMSKRAGNFIMLRDIVDRVGKDITRYMMISRHHNSVIDFDFQKVIECTMDNPLFYIQYAYARICSVFRRYEEVFGAITDQELIHSDRKMLSDKSEFALMKVLSFWPECVKASAIAVEPHRIPCYLREIAHSFHSLWNAGKVNTELRFVSPDDKPGTISRMSLLMATRIVLEDGLKLIGVTPMTVMA